MSAPVTVTDAIASASGRPGGGQRTEHGQQDHEDGGQPDHLGRGEVLLQDVGCRIDERGDPDHVRDDAVAGLSDVERFSHLPTRRPGRALAGAGAEADDNDTGRRRSEPQLRRAGWNASPPGRLSALLSSRPTAAGQRSRGERRLARPGRPRAAPGRRSGSRARRRAARRPTRNRGRRSRSPSGLRTGAARAGPRRRRPRATRRPPADRAARAISPAGALPAAPSTVPL